MSRRSVTVGTPSSQATPLAGDGAYLGHGCGSLHTPRVHVVATMHKETRPRAWSRAGAGRGMLCGLADYGDGTRLAWAQALRNYFLTWRSGTWG
jgi:hypothetical protein